MSPAYIKIAKKPEISEETDRWGRGSGKYYVNNVVGYVEELSWKNITAYEHYYVSKEGNAELTKIASQLAAQLQSGKVSSVEAPYMKSLIDIPKSQVWQFNIYAHGEYFRTYAVFGEVTLYVWTPEHDEEVTKLQEQVDVLNLKETK